VATAVKINPVNAIDLSDSATWGGAGYLVNTNAPRVLTFQQNGEYYVYQSGASLIRNIVVNDNVTATITIDGITVTSSAQDVPAFALKGSAKVTLILENNNTLTQTATNEGNNAALNVPSGASITLYGSGKLDARSGVNSAAIGGGQNSSGGTIEISGGTVTATAGLYGAGIGSGHRGIGCTTTIDSGIITISGGTVTATGGAFGAGIGGGYNSNGGTTTINGGIVTATGRIGGAGIGGGLADTNFTKTGVGGTIAIGGNAKVTATGGRNSFSYAYAGAGLGSGGDQPDGGTITITGNANVTATGGLNELSSGTHGGAGIGSGYVSGGNGACALTIDASATVKAYAYGSGAIQSANNGEGCFVNAYFNDTDKADLPVSGGTRLDIYEKLAAVKTNELVLPEGYYAFAYTTKNSKTQDDRILAYGASTGSILGTVLRSINNSEKIESVKKSNERLAVKLGSSPGVPSVPDITPSVTNVTENEATFTSTGHALLNTVAFVSGGFQYSLNPDMSNATLVPWNIGGFTTAPVSVSATGLEANTRYYMRTQLTARVDVEDFPASGKIEERTYYSEVVPFATLPKIISANVKPDQAGEKTLVSAKFYESTKNKAKITNVTVYWSTGSIDASDPGKVTASGGATLNSQTLEGAAFSDSGFSDYGITTPGAKNNVLIVVTNEDGRRASYAPATTLTISSEVGGNYADTTKEFAMRVKFTYKDGEALAANTAFSYTGSAISGVTAPAGGILRTNEDGEVFFGLRHGQSITIAGVVSDGTVQITQTKALAYSAVSFTDSEGNGGESNDTGVRNMTPNSRSFSFTSTRDNVAPAGIDGGNINAMLLLPLLGLLALFGFWIIRRVYCRRNGGDRR
jgi:hypothetical protein